MPKKKCKTPPSAEVSITNNWCAHCTEKRGALKDNWYCVVYKNDFPAHHKYIQAKQLDYFHERGVYL